MLMEEEGAGLCMQDDLFATDDDLNGGDELSMDLDAFWDILEEPPKQNSGMDSSLENMLQGDKAPDVGIYQNSHPESGFQVIEKTSSLGTELSHPVMFYPSSNSEALDSRTGSDISFESAGNSLLVDCGRQEPSAQFASPIHTCSQNHEDWYSHPLVHETCVNERDRASKNEMQSCSRTSSFFVGGAKNVSDFRDNSYVDVLKEETGTRFKHAEDDTRFKYMLHRPLAGNLDLTLRNSGGFKENSKENLGAFENNQLTSLDIALGDADMFSHNATSIESTIFQNSGVISDFGNYSATQFCMDEDAKLYASPSFSLFPKNPRPYILRSNEDIMTNRKDEPEELIDRSACSSVNGQGGRAGRFSEVSSIDASDVNRHYFKYSNHISPTIGNSFSTIDHRSVNEEFSLPLSCTRSYTSRKNEAISVKDERSDELVGPRSMMQNSVGIIDEALSRKSSYDTDGELLVEQDSEQSLPGITRHSAVHIKDEKKLILESERARHFQNVSDGNASRSRTDGEYLRLDAPEQYAPFMKPCASSKKQIGCIQNESDGKLIHSKRIGSDLSKFSSESIQSNISDGRSFADNDPDPDPDICIIDDTSQIAFFNQPLVPGNSHFTLQSSTRSDPVHYMGAGGTRKANDEQLIYRAALQDLSQPRSESNLPDGLLAVPLLRHQRIALSWMVQKETSSLHCSGGILADDQGLGKTVSTIALILKEKPPLFRACQEDVKQGELETLDLDEDGDGIVEVVKVKDDDGLSQLMSNGNLMKKRNAVVNARPAAGTLVVCPTSVLRQWAEELRSKVDSKANISVLVYHGSNRTKDPSELARYDVVLTTYSIVSMEVPKQPLVDKDGDEKKKSEPNVVPPIGFSTSKKRKHSSISDASHEPVARPLARVGWFRVVLDEAQSIKNHRTHVARACWGLRAKRRWCLSGTPIQNAIDDLYSYFRFLRYDPYAVYKFFCETIKVPISRNPSKGYKKLQAVLKTIMLRRTKGTLLDGEPIVALPPKTVELKKVDFSKEERDFYTRLEADSRAQFEEYAAAGTVKQNYVNILLMLLRLRQACDHPLLVKGFDSYSIGRSSIEMAKKLPREKQIYLLKYLEASLAICGLCNDPPEDAVVSICGHVFCNQCICEHLTGDDNKCPTTNCKVPLGVSSVFSKATLNSSISEHPGKYSSDLARHELVEVGRPSFDLQLHDSSKIKAALEVLQSLSRPKDCNSRYSSLMDSFDETTNYPKSSSDSLVGESPMDMAGHKSSNKSVSIVGEKAIVFSQWTKMLDLLENCLKGSSIQYRRLDGTMSVVARDKAVKDFNTMPEVSVMIMSLKAASLGLNMVAACHVLLLDLWWNPTTEDQAIDRAHRIGQTRPVKVLRLTVKDTVEDRILALQQKKREMVSSAFGEDETGSCQTRLTVEDLKYLFMV